MTFIPEGKINTIIKVENLTKKYTTGKTHTIALREISFEIEKGEFIAVIGSSGAGKTTLLNILGGLDRDYKGMVWIDGVELHSLSDRKLSVFRNEKIGFVFQAFHLLNHLTVEENICLPSLFAKNEREVMEGKVDEILEIVGLKEKREAFPHHLSAGERQRVAISRAIFNNPKILLCDEPTGNLDDKTAETILNLFKNLNSKFAITIVAITHEERVSNCAKRIIRLEAGRIV